MGPVEILLTVLGLSVLVIVHESGHYFAARAFGMRVIRFSIGFGPPLFRYTPKGSPTTFQVCAVPFLAYVQVAGMNPHEEVEADDPGLFTNKGVFARIVTIAAGPVANYLMASLLVFGLALSGWPPEAVAPVTVDRVLEEMPAAEAGLQEGDVIVMANGQAIKDFEDLKEATAPRAGQPTTYVVERNGKRLQPLTITPKGEPGDAKIGVAPRLGPATFTLGESAKTALVLPLDLSIRNLQGMAELVRRRSTEGLVGPVGMGKLVAEQVERGPQQTIATLVLLSVALGLFNLLPFPALDGGRLVFLGYELVTRRKPNKHFEAVVHAVGLFFLLGVLVLVTFRDVMS